MKRRIYLLAAAAMLLSLLTGSALAAQREEVIRWSAPRAATYGKIHPYTLNWTGDVLDRGGLALSTLEVTSSSAQADFVINQYGAIGASGIRKLTDENLETETKTSVTGFTSSLTMEQGATYLIILHDGSFAKIRIDRILPDQGTSITKVQFTYVTEAQRVAQGEATSPAPQPAQPVGGGVYTPPFSIYLSISSVYSTIYNKTGQKTEYALHAAPMVHQNRTLVPLRYIAEALGAQVSWNGADSSVTILGETTSIVLWLDKPYAVVNGVGKTLDAAPIARGGYTMVPLRFIGENLGMFVYYNAGMILITDTEDKSFEQAVPAKPQAPQAPQPDVPKPGAQDSTAQLHGKWNLWVPGSFQQFDVGGVSVQGNYVPGATADWIEILADGTYRWLDLNKLYTGTWSASGEGQILIYGGPMQSDWYMRLTARDEAKIYAWGLEYKAYRMIG